MHENKPVSETVLLGQIVIFPDESPLPQDPNGCPLPFKRSQIYEWRPAAKLRDQLPAGFHLRLRCITGDDNVRRFTQWMGLSALSRRPSRLDLPSLQRERNLRPNSGTHTEACFSFSRAFITRRSISRTIC